MSCISLVKVRRFLSSVIHLILGGILRLDYLIDESGFASILECRRRYDYKEMKQFFCTNVGK